MQIRIARPKRLRISILAFACLTAVACKSDSVSLPTAATVTLSGAPSAAMHVGTTVQMSATALSNSGSIISGADIHWESSNATVASISGGGLLSALAAGTTTITASSGTGVATAQVTVVSALAVSSSSTVSMPDGKVSLSLLPGMGGPILVVVNKASDSWADSKVVPGTIYQLAPSSSLDFGTIGNITLKFDPALLPAGVTAEGLLLYRRASNGTWHAVRKSSVNTTTRTVTGVSDLNGTYAARFSPVDRVLISGGQIDGAIVVGQSAPLFAAAVNVIGDTLAGRTITWSSSATGIATVNAQGVVTGVSPGTAQLTASAEGISASTSISVAARPIASWVGTLDWTTYRGNNRRTGYVDVTLDPFVFAPKWDVTIPGLTGWSLNDAVTGSGNVFVTSYAFNTSQGIWALDANTGAIKWTRAFGNIASANGPAFGNGRVYAATGGHQDSFFWSFDANNGDVIFRVPYGNQWYRWNAPAVTPTTVFFAGGYFGGISAINALDGAELWRRDLQGEDNWTPAADGGEAFVFGGTSEVLTSLLRLDGATGTATPRAPNLGLPQTATPVLGGNDEVFGIRNSRLFAVDVARNVIAWDLPGAYQGVPAVDGTNVYAAINGAVEARARATGTLAWTWVPQSGMSATGSVIVTRNLMFVHLVAANGTSPGRVIALDLATRKVVWSHDADGEMALGNGMLIITSRTSPKVTAISVR